jgi:hypothetical protein
MFLGVQIRDPYPSTIQQISLHLLAIWGPRLVTTPAIDGEIQEAHRQSSRNSFLNQATWHFFHVSHMYQLQGMIPTSKPSFVRLACCTRCTRTPNLDRALKDVFGTGTFR